jgi:hypothetical protein
MRRHISSLLSGFLLLLSLPFAANADMPGQHPFYLHALGDLRGARWLFQHRPGGAATSADEDVAIGEIDIAIREIRAAAIDDGKDINDHMGIDVPGDPRARLHHARDLLMKVHDDVAREEDDPVTRQLRNRAVVHIDAALRAADHAIINAERGR